MKQIAETEEEGAKSGHGSTSRRQSVVGSLELGVGKKPTAVSLQPTASEKREGRGKFVAGSLKLGVVKKLTAVSLQPTDSEKRAGRGGQIPGKFKAES